MSFGKHHIHEREGEAVSIFEFLDWLWSHPVPRTGRMMPALIWGSQGIGKTEQVKQFCAAKGILCSIFHTAQYTSGADVAGERFTDESGQSRYSVPAWMPDDPEGKGGILFLDEINRGNREVLNGLMELAGEGKIGPHRLPPNWGIVAAANPAEQAGMGQEAFTVSMLDQALIDRFLHFQPGFDPATWTAWAIGAGLHPKAIDFALRNPQLVEAEELGGFPKEVEDALSASPRSIESLSRVLPKDDEEIPERLLIALAQGLLGLAGAEEFMQDWHSNHGRITLRHLLRPGWEPVVQQLVSAPSNDENSRILHATAVGIVGELLVLDPSSEDGKRAFHGAGRYLAALTPDLREEMIAIAERSAPHLREILDRAAAHYLRQRR